MFAPVQTRRASDEIIGQIRGQLEQGRLKPGDRLPPERELAETFRVSRNTVREAVRTLENNGLLELRKGATGGAFVTDHGGMAIVSAFGDLFALGVFRPEHLAEARTIVGTSAARLACERASDEELAGLADCVERAVAAGRSGDIETRSAANFEFHRLLAEASGNPILVILTEAISEINKRFAERAGPPPNRQILPSRKRLMKQLLARDAEGAVAEIAVQIKAVERFYSKAIGRRNALAGRKGET